MKTEYMVEYLSLAKTLSFTKTAADLYTMQPTLSKHLQALEDEIGSPLLIRNTREMSLTEEGRIVAGYFEKILDEYNGMMRDVSLASQGITGSIEVGYMENGLDFLESGIDTFYEKYPKIELTLTPMHPGKIIESLHGGQIDVGLIFQTSQLPQRDFAFEQLGRYDWMVVFSDKNPLASEAEVSFDELKGQPMVQAQTDDAFSELRSKLMEENGFEPTETIYCSESNLMAVVIRTRGGYYIGSDSAQRKHLVARPLRTRNPSCIPIGLAYLEENRNPSIPLFVGCF